MRALVISLSVWVIILTATLCYVVSRLDAATNYIEALETDYPDFIDTTSGTDAYSDWYNQ